MPLVEMAAGSELGYDSDASDDSVRTCENCRWCRAAYALHMRCIKSASRVAFWQR